MSVRTVPEALGRPPWRFLRSSWPWRALVYLLCGAVQAAAVAAAVAILRGLAGPATDALGTGTGWAVVVPAGVCLLAVVVGLAGWLERRRLGLVDRTWRATAEGVPRTPFWREAGHAAVSALALWWIDLGVVAVALVVPGLLVTVPLQPTAAGPAPVLLPIAGVVLLPAAAYVITGWAGARSLMARSILLPPERELNEVVRSRARLVDAFEAERRRIERDLHDGAQQRLVALTVQLGLAGLDLPPGSDAARAVGEARDVAKHALEDLRELIRGVHPQVLTERGLLAAVRDVAGRSPVPVDVAGELPGRLPAPVEMAAYFVVCEALANVAKHSAARHCRVSCGLAGGLLRIDVRDDGRGGADPAAGTGLLGLADRTAVVEGTLLVSSPAGRGTLIRMEAPCAT